MLTLSLSIFSLHIDVINTKQTCEAGQAQATHICTIPQLEETANTKPNQDSQLVLRLHSDESFLRLHESIGKKLVCVQPIWKETRNGQDDIARSRQP